MRKRSLVIGHILAPAAAVLWLTVPACDPTGRPVLSPNAVTERPGTTGRDGGRPTTDAATSRPDTAASQGDTGTPSHNASCVTASFLRDQYASVDLASANVRHWLSTPEGWTAFPRTLAHDGAFLYQCTGGGLRRTTLLDTEVSSAAVPCSVVANDGPELYAVVGSELIRYANFAEAQGRPAGTSVGPLFQAVTNTQSIVMAAGMNLVYLLLNGGTDDSAPALVEVFDDSGARLRSLTLEGVKRGTVEGMSARGGQLVAVVTEGKPPHASLRTFDAATGKLVSNVEFPLAFQDDYKGLGCPRAN
jgi:hypothetical protein